MTRDPSPPNERRRASDRALGPQSPAVSALASGGVEQPFFRLDISRSFQLHKRLAIGIALTGLALGGLYVAKTWPVYIAQSQVYVQPAPPKVVEQGTVPRWPYDASTYDSFIQQQLQTASHPEVLLSALHKLDSGSWQRPDESEQAAADRLGRAIEVKRVGASYQIEISAKAKDATLAARIANAMAASMIESESLQERAGDSQRLAMLRDEHARVVKELEADRAEQESLNTKLGVAGIGSATPDHYDEEIGKIRDELVKARTDHEEAAARLISLDTHRSASSAALNAEADELIASDPGLVSMKTSLNQQRAVLITQMANLTPNHPQRKQDEQELAQIDASLDAMMRDLRAKASARIQQRIRTDLDRTSEVEEQLNAQLRQMTGGAAGATPKLQRANDLATDILRLQSRQTSVDEQLHNLMLEDNAPGAAHLSAAATPPAFPNIVGTARVALPILLGGVIFGLLAALIANNLDPRVYIAADLENVLGFAPMAQLPNFDEVSEGVAEEHLLRLSTAIEHARQQGHLKSCIFTGIEPGAGATTVSTRVRSLLEAMGRTSILVDASGTPPPPPRFSSEELELQDVPGLQLAQRGSRSTALLNQLVEVKEEEESLVLTDTAPLPISAETQYLARYVDAVIVIAESGVTTRSQLRDVASTLQKLNVSAVGFVLNRICLNKADAPFRQSIRAVEAHLKSQSRTTARRTERNQPFSPEDSPPGGGYFRRESDMRVKAVQVAMEPIAQAPEEAVAAGKSTAAAPAELFERRVARTVPEENLVASAPVAPVDAPPVAPRLPRADASRPAAPAQPVIAIEIPAAEVSPVAPVASPVPSQTATAPTAQEQSWDRLGGGLFDRREPIAEGPHDAELETAVLKEFGGLPKSRLSDLRNLAFTAGLKSLRPRVEEAHWPAEPASPMEQEAELVSFSRNLAQPLDAIPVLPLRTAPDTISPTLVTAPPEFLPPKPLDDEARNELTRTPSSASRRDRREAFDEVQVLPSRRGQYKRK